MKTKIIMMVFFLTWLSAYSSQMRNNFLLAQIQSNMKPQVGLSEGTSTSKIHEIKLEAFQFGFSPEKIVVKKGDTVKIYLTSRDVTHGLYIKEYGINVTVKKGETKIVEFIADKTGEFEFRCSVYCGSGHDKMKGKLVVG